MAVLKSTRAGLLPSGAFWLAPGPPDWAELKIGSARNGIRTDRNRFIGTTSKFQYARKRPGVGEGS
jgi:hypothetical protein